jgi:hypothetical protein
MGFAQNEGLSIPAGRAAFHAAQTSDAAERLVVEPVLRALSAEILPKERDLALDRRGGEWEVEVGMAKIAVPFRDLVLEDQVFAKRIPRSAAISR